VARSAYGEFVLALGGKRCVMPGAGKTQHIMGYCFYLCLTAQRRTQRRHHAVAAIGDAGFDCFRVAAIEPVMVAQIGEAADAAGVRAMAL